MYEIQQKIVENTRFIFEHGFKWWNETFTFDDLSTVPNL